MSPSLKLRMISLVANQIFMDQMFHKLKTVNKVLKLKCPQRAITIDSTIIKTTSVTDDMINLCPDNLGPLE